jgi:hypothetical protein
MFCLVWVTHMSSSGPGVLSHICFTQLYCGINWKVYMGKNTDSVSPVVAHFTFCSSHKIVIFYCLPIFYGSVSGTEWQSLLQIWRLWSSGMLLLLWENAGNKLHQSTGTSLPDYIESQPRKTWYSHYHQKNCRSLMQYPCFLVGILHDFACLISLTDWQTAWLAS